MRSAVGAVVSAILFGVSGALSVEPANAFQKEPVTTSAAPAMAPMAPKKVPSLSGGGDQPAPALDNLGGAAVELTTPEKTAPEGTEIRIPGLGKLGVLPKLDFGLELLYGAQDSAVIDDEPGDGDQLTIRGRVKHRF